MLFKRLELKNLLSFIDTKVELRPLNVLIGANASGKSNLIEAISLLQSAPVGFENAIRRGGGVRSWVSIAEGAGPVASMDCGVADEDARDLQYRLSFASESHSVVIAEESLADGVVPYFTRRGSRVEFHETVTVPPAESVLSVYKSPSDPTPVTKVGRLLEHIRIYREFATSGPNDTLRIGVSVTAPKDRLAENGGNLARVLQERYHRRQLERIEYYLNRFCDRFGSILIGLEGVYVQTYVEEKGLRDLLPASRLSDGTLKFLCLATALLDPDPPPLLCFEEPEIGLHPEAIQLVAELLVEASAKTQVIVTTHSKALVDAFTDRPETVLVCERDFGGGTQFVRLDEARLRTWLERYTLGDLWEKGEIGGTRW